MQIYADVHCIHLLMYVCTIHTYYMCMYKKQISTPETSDTGPEILNLSLHPPCNPPNLPQPYELAEFLPVVPETCKPSA